MINYLYYLINSNLRDIMSDPRKTEKKPGKIPNNLT